MRETAATRERERAGKDRQAETAEARRERQRFKRLERPSSAETDTMMNTVSDKQAETQRGTDREGRGKVH